jgi:hypothetical protein
MGLEILIDLGPLLKMVKARHPLNTMIKMDKLIDHFSFHIDDLRGKAALQSKRLYIRQQTIE